MAADPGAPSNQLISAVVCTRDRGDRIASTLETILAGDAANFEVVVVDQSDSDDTEAAVRRFADDPRLRYHRSDERGLGRARNTGLDLASGAIVAFTDDDVTVPADWLRTMHAVFDDHPQVGVAFCNVTAAPHDPDAGFVPTYERTGSVEITTVRGKCRARGIGAGLAVRAAALADIGGFDALLGAGGRFSSCEDGDVALRGLLAGWHVYETDQVTVVHDGFRTWAEGRELTRRDWYGIGAAYAKPIAARRFGAIVVVAYEGVWRAIVQPWQPVLSGQRPQGLKRGAYFWKGFVAGLRTPVDRQTLLFEVD